MDRPKQNSPLILAAIDIGSNAARMLIKQVQPVPGGFRYKKLLFLRIPLRLGLDVFQMGRIGKERIKLLERTMDVFANLMAIHNVHHHLIYATSAFRDAENSANVIRLIKKTSKLNICVISGQEEAEIIRQNFHAEGNLLHVDVGGGSTELSLVCNGTLMGSCSANIGTIRLLRKTVTPNDWSDFFAQVRRLVHGVNHLRIVGSGGNINKLARLADPSEKHQLSVATLKKLHAQMAALSVEQRMAQFDLSESRADVIVPAAQIFIMVAHLTQASVIIVPNVGLADGMICRLANASPVTPASPTSPIVTTL